MPQFDHVSFESVYPGIDVRFYGAGTELEFDLDVAAGACLEDIVIDLEASKSLAITAAGDLATGAQVLLRKPVAFQNGLELACEFVLRSPLQVGIDVPGRDVGLPMVIDPLLVFSSYLGGSLLDRAEGVAMDNAGYLYVAGSTLSTDFPLLDAYQPAASMPRFALFVSKIDVVTGTLIYSTYLGGTTEEICDGLAVDSAGRVIVVGYSISDDYPVVGAFQPSRAGGHDAVVTVLAPDGQSLVHSSYLGGSDYDNAEAVAVDAADNIFIGGATVSTDFPTISAFQPALAVGLGADSFITKLPAGGGSPIFSTFFGGTRPDIIVSICADDAGRVAVTGLTTSADLPLASPLQGTFSGGLWDSFVSQFDGSGQTLLFSTLLGGRDSDEARGIAADRLGNLLITGTTHSPDFPVASPLQGTYGGQGDIFIMKIDPAGAVLQFSTYLGGPGIEEGAGIESDTQGNIYVAASVRALGVPITGDAFQPNFGGMSDAYVTQLRNDGASVRFGSFLGGPVWDTVLAIAMAPGRRIAVAGSSAGPGFPVVLPVQPVFGGGSHDAFVSVIDLSVLCGDCNGDGMVNVIDAFYAAEHAVQLRVLGGASFSRCNVTGAFEPDPLAAVDVRDAFAIAWFAVGGPVLSCF